MTVYGNGAFDSPRIGPLEIMAHVQQQGEMGRQRGERSYLGRLFSQAMTADKDQQSGLTALMAKVSPEAAMSAQGYFQQQQDRQRQLLTEKARVMRSLSPERRAAMWPTLRSEIVRADSTLSTLPEVYDPAEFDPVIDHYAALGEAEGPKVVGAGGALVSPDGTPLFQNPHKPPNPWAPQPIPVPDGQGGTVLQVFDPNTRTFSPYRGQGEPQPQQQASQGFLSDSFAPIANAMIAAGIPAEQVDSILVNAAQSSPGMQVQAGQMGYTPPKAGQGSVMTLSPEEVVRAGFPSGSVIQRKPDGSLTVVSRPNAGAASKSAEQEKVDIGAAGLAAEAQAFAASFTGVSIDEIRKMTPAQVRDLVNGEAVTMGGRMYRAQDRFFTGPIMGRVPFADSLANPDLVAYQNAAAGRQARINNPTGPVSNADFEIAAKSTFSPDKPKSVNADLIYKALTSGSSGSAPPATTASDLSDEELLQELGL